MNGMAVDGAEKDTDRTAEEDTGVSPQQPLLSLTWSLWLSPARDALVDGLLSASEQLRLLEVALLDLTGLRRWRAGCVGRLAVGAEDAEAPLRRNFLRARLALMAEATVDMEPVAGCRLEQVEAFAVFAYQPIQPTAESLPKAAEAARLVAERCSAVGLSVLTRAEASELSMVVVRVTVDVRTVIRCLGGCHQQWRHDDYLASSVPRLLRSIIDPGDAAADYTGDRLELRYCDSQHRVEIFPASRDGVAKGVANIIFGCQGLT